MSIDLMRTAYQKEVDAKTQRVLIILCDFANDAGVCWPSIDRIAWKLGISERTVMRAIKILEASGAVEVRRQHRHTNVYLLHLDKLPNKPPYVPPYEAILGDKVSESEQSLGDILSGLGDKVSKKEDKMSPQPPIEPPEPPKDKSRKRSTGNVDFDRFWEIFPNQDEKKKAQEFWDKINPDTDLVETIIAAVERQMRSEKWQGGFVKAAFRWLRDENWTDGGLVAVKPAGPPGVDLLPGENVEQVGPGEWNLVGRDGQVRKIRPDYCGVIFDTRKHLYEGLNTFTDEVAKAREGKHGHANTGD